MNITAQALVLGFPTDGLKFEFRNSQSLQKMGVNRETLGKLQQVQISSPDLKVQIQYPVGGGRGSVILQSKVIAATCKEVVE